MRVARVRMRNWWILALLLALLPAGCRRPDPDPAVDAFHRGNTCLEKDDYDGAIAEYDQAIRLDPEFGEAYLNRSAAYFGKFNNAGEAGSDREDLDRALADVERALEINPSDPKAISNQVLIETAHALEQQRLALKKSMEGILGPLRPLELALEGNTLVADGKYDEAIAKYNEAMELDDQYGYGALYLQRGLAYAKKGETELAHRDFQRATMVAMLNGIQDPGMAQPLKVAADAFTAEGNLYKEQGKLEEAEESFKKAQEYTRLAAKLEYNQGFLEHLSRARKHVEDDELNSALTEYNSALRFAAERSEDRADGGSDAADSGLVFGLDSITLSSVYQERAGVYALMGDDENRRLDVLRASKLFLGEDIAEVEALTPDDLPDAAADRRKRLVKRVLEHPDRAGLGITEQLAEEHTALVWLILETADSPEEDRKSWIDRIEGMDQPERDQLASKLFQRQYPELHELITRSQSTSQEERNYWFNALPTMTADEQAEIKRIFLNEREQLAAIHRKFGRKTAEWQVRAGCKNLEEGEYGEAIKAFTEAIERVTDWTEPYRLRFKAYARIGDYEKARADARTALQLEPEDPGLRNSFAWTLATFPDEKMRDGKLAIEHASKACELTEWKDPFFWDTLAAAYAEAENFEEAVRWQQKAVEHPDFAKQMSEEGLEEARNRLDLYKVGKPYREPAD